MTNTIKKSIFILGCFVTVLSVIYYKFALYPAGHRIDLIRHALCFYTLSAFLIISISSLGQIIRSKLIRSDLSQIDLALGFGLFSWFLSFYNKFDVRYPVPVILLVLFFFLGLRSLLLKREIYRRRWNTFAGIWICTLFVILVVQLSIFGAFDGLLMFTTDFDSGFMHIPLPQTILSFGHHFSPPWIRGPFIPQLTHNWYLLFLDVFKSDASYLKVFNLIYFYQVFRIFTSFKSTIGVYLAGPMLVLVSILPETNYLFSTNLDAILGMLVIAQFYVFYCIVKNGVTLDKLILVTVLSGLSAGQKHFGLMFSVPVLIIVYLMFIVKNKYYKIEMQGDYWKKIAILVASGVCFFIVFIPFYMHNLIAGSSLLFPFLGGLENNLGWSLDELRDFTGTVVGHWGHRKDVWGFFTLPFDIMKYPGEYQFARSSKWFDIVVPFLILSNYGIFVFSLLIKRYRYLSVLAGVLILQLVFWYKGSQVVRYIFPITLAYFFVHYLFIMEITRSLRNYRARKLIPIASIILCVVLLFPHLTRITYAVPQNNPDLMNFKIVLFGNPIKSDYYIAANSSHAKVLEIGPLAMSYRAHFPDILFCGDWFGLYKFSKFTSTIQPIRLQEWKDLKKNVNIMDFDYISIHWDQIVQSRRPVTEEEWKKALSESTGKCLEHVYYNGEQSDVYKIKQECKN